MKNKGLVVTIVITLLLSFQVIVPNVSAHTGGTFTIILSKNGVQPYNVQMLVNDTARWINVDDTENITHQILVDADSDGIYDDEDWNSGTLTNSCEHVNGTKVDEECNAYGGHLFSGTITATCEMIIMISQNKLLRKMNDHIGLHLWDLNCEK